MSTNDYPTLDDVKKAQPSSNQYPPYYQNQQSNYNQTYNSNQYQNYNPYPNYNYNQPNKDMTSHHSLKYEELYEDKPNIDTREMMRAGFIIKVYGILAFQLSISVASVCLIFIPSVEQFFARSEAASNLLFVAFIGSLVTIIMLSCCKLIARQVPINYILMTLFTVFESYILQFICTQYEPHSVLIAGVLTAAVTCTLALYALKTKTDYTSCGAFLFACLTILIIGSIIGIFWRSYFYETMLACIGIVLFSVYLIFDIQLISGKFKQEYDIDDYIMASMNVYLDIINLFLKILQILGVKKK